MSSGERAQTEFHEHRMSLEDHFYLTESESENESRIAIALVFDQPAATFYRGRRRGMSKGKGVALHSWRLRRQPAHSVRRDSRGKPRFRRVASAD